MTVEHAKRKTLEMHIMNFTIELQYVDLYRWDLFPYLV